MRTDFKQLTNLEGISVPKGMRRKFLHLSFAIASTVRFVAVCGLNNDESCGRQTKSAPDFGIARDSQQLLVFYMRILDLFRFIKTTIEFHSRLSVHILCVWCDDVNLISINTYSNQIRVRRLNLIKEKCSFMITRHVSITRRLINERTWSHVSSNSLKWIHFCIHKVHSTCLLCNKA